MITLDQLIAIMPHSRSRAERFIGPLNDTMTEFGIHTPKQQAAYLPQVGHESGQLLYVQEIWGPTEAQRRYEGRKDLGNTQPGDGRRFAGKGLFQITGRANTLACALHFDMSLDEVLPWLVTPEGAARSSGWFWQSRDLNRFADSGDFLALTKKINGGTNGLADRLELWARAKTILGAA